MHGNDQKTEAIAKARKLFEMGRGKSSLKRLDLFLEEAFKLSHRAFFKNLEDLGLISKTKNCLICRLPYAPEIAAGKTQEGFECCEGCDGK